MTTNDWATAPTGRADLADLVGKFHQLHHQLKAAAPELFGDTAPTAQIPPADAVQNADGSVDLNVRLRFQNPFDINTTGVGTITVLPDGSLAQFMPLLGVGPAGPALNYEQPDFNEIDPSVALPNPAIVDDLIDPGDPNATPPTAPTRRLTFNLHKGAKGDPGTPVELEFLANIFGTPVDASMLIYRVADGYWHIEHVRYITHAAATAFTDASGTSPSQTLATVSINAKTWSQTLQPFGRVQVNPAADGSTKIQLEAHLNSAAGPLIGLGAAVQQATPFMCTLLPTPAAVDPANAVAANQPASVVLVARQLNNASTGQWSTTCANGGIFQVDGHPIV